MSCKPNRPHTMTSSETLSSPFQRSASLPSWHPRRRQQQNRVAREKPPSSPILPHQQPPPPPYSPRSPSYTTRSPSRSPLPSPLHSPRSPGYRARSPVPSSRSPLSSPRSPQGGTGFSDCYLSAPSASTILQHRASYRLATSKETSGRRMEEKEVSKRNKGKKKRLTYVKC